MGAQNAFLIMEHSLYSVAATRQITGILHGTLDIHVYAVLNIYMIIYTCINIFSSLRRIFLILTYSIVVGHLRHLLPVK